MKHGGCVYIIASKRNGTLYVGVTAQLVERIQEHRTMEFSESFTAKYGCKMLVYYQTFGRIRGSHCRRKTLKEWE